MRTSLDDIFNEVKRESFLPVPVKDLADYDQPLPIGHGQTNSQPATVRLMMEWLEARPGDKVLDIGSGSGWTTALLARIVGPKGRVYAVERVPELVKFGQENCRRIGVKNAEFYKAKDTLGLPDKAPFDRILVSASARELPKELLMQLKKDGRLVIPVRHDILVITKTGHDTFNKITHSGFVFVPLIS